EDEKAPPVEGSCLLVGPCSALDLEAPLDFRDLHRLIRCQIGNVDVASLPVPEGVVRLGQAERLGFFMRLSSATSCPFLFAGLVMGRDILNSLVETTVSNQA